MRARDSCGCARLRVARVARVCTAAYHGRMRSLSGSTPRRATRLARTSLALLLGCAAALASALACGSIAACGGAVGDDVVAASDASSDTSRGDALGDTHVGDAPVFPTEDGSTDASDASDAAPAPDTGAPKTCSIDADCASAPGAHTCCAGRCVDTATNLDHCGRCSQPCRLDHATGVCAAGSCKVSTCAAPWMDCNGAPGDGCEVDTSSSAASCGSCAHACVASSGTAACSGSACAITACPAGTGDCNHAFADGCEANFATDPSNCGGCGSKPTERCNLADDDCNGRCDDLAGCRVAVARSVNGASGEHFYSSDAAEAACCGFTVENSPYFFLYASAQAGLVPIYRCVLGTGFHLLTTSSACEGAPGATLEGQMGWIGTSAACGATPLYRLAHGNDHFFTTSAPERDAAIASGYVSEGTAGWVWTTPQG